MTRLATLTALMGIILVEVMGIPFAAAQPGELATLEEQAMQAAVARVADSVVRIETVGGLEKVGSVLIGTGPTTGLVVDADGYVISSTYNFIQKPTSILVTLPSGKKAAAEIVTRDNSRKLVLLKVNTDEKLKVPTAVPAAEVEIGQWAIAVGKTFGGDFPNLSVGIISAKNRIWGRAIQSDSKISPTNYGGPLVDIQGRVFGVLTPQSPQNESAAGGAEWYDSGIGFAIPLEDVFAVLERLKSGEELYRGLLGISLKGKNDMSDAAIIAAAPAGTPAAKAGIKSGDQVVSVNGNSVQTQSQLKMALGRFYAGDEIALRLKRDDKEIGTKAILTDKVEPYQLPCLGLLPMRTAPVDNDQAGVKIRYVYPDSAADKAGIQVGDTLRKLNKQELATATAWREALAAIDLEETITIEVDRDGETIAVKLKPGKQPETIPQDLPAASEELEEADEKSATGTIEVKIPEESNKCYALIPENYDARIPHGVVLWLAEPGEFDQEAMANRWTALCEKHHLMVLAPQPNKAKQWERTEIDFIRKTLDDLSQNYTIDENRVVVHGFKTGASIGYYFALKNREVVRGIAAVDAAVPILIRVEPNDPIERLAWYISWSKKSPLAKRIDKDIKRLRKLRFPVTANDREGVEYLGGEELTELARWIDSLDRL